jgi:translation initiation factor IF-2
MASTGTKLFKIASQINVGKETIVAFLQAKGFAIENKATSTLTGDMVDLVLGNFQKEAAAALKQREKDAPQHEEVHNEVHQNVVSMQSSEPHQSDSSHNAEQQVTQVVHQNEVSSAPSPENTDVQKDVPHYAKVDNGAAVGTVIQLDDSSSRRKSKKTKAEEIPQPSVDDIRKTEQSAPKDITEEQKPVLDAKVEPATAAQESIQEHSSVATTIDVVQSPDSPVVAQPDETVPSTLQGADAEALGADEEIDDTQEDHTEEGKRKRKKRIGEVEYFVDNAPYATPMPTGLTILGKIELGGRRGDGSSKDGNKAPERGGERGGRGGGGGKPAPRTGAQSGDARPKPGAAAAKPKDWTKPGAPAPAKKFGTVGGTSSTTAAGSAANKKKRKKGKREQVSAVEVDKAIRRTLSGQEESQLAMRSRLRRSRKQERADEQAHQAELRELDDAILRVTEFITVAELAENIGVATNEIILKCMSLGLMVSINQRLEKDTITLIAADYGLEVEFEDAFAEEALEEDDEDDEEFLEARAPIVTVMGHVDHGKTSLLDHIRKTSVVSGESGGITQHIGAYSVKMNDGKFITFLDTPGHQAFTAMRARGAQLTDLVVLVVAADDNVMPQTIEAISHARAANVPMIVAINKMDKADANPDKVRQQLSDHNVLVEEWGGKFQSAMISAKKGTNIDQLLEKILLEAEILNLRANPDRYARGTVVESKIDKGKGTVATVVVQKGTLRVGDPFLCGIHSGRVRAMFNENGERIEEAIPSTPVQILGFDGVPQAGDSFVAMESEVEARDIATTRQQIKREQDFKRVRHVTLDDIASRIKAGGVQELKIILKGDTDGSVEALTDSLQKLSTEEVKVSIIHRAVGSILEADVMLAAASEAIIVGFHVRPNPQVAKLAENEGVDIRLYRIIYDCINEVKLALEGMLLPEIKEEVVGVAEVREVFKISKLGNIAGCYMLEGKINRNDTIRVLRDGFEVFTGRLASLKRMKEDVKEIDAGFECGMSVDGFNDIQNGDLIEAVRKTEIKRKL